MRKNLAFLLFPFISLLQFFSCVLDAPLKKNNLLICACLSFGDYSLFVNANQYYPDQKLRHDEQIFYRRTNIDTFNHLFFWSNLSSHTFQLFLEPPQIIWKIRCLWTASIVFPRIRAHILISILPRISAHSLGQHIKKPPPFSPRISAFLLPH